MPPDAHVVVRKESASARLFDSGGAPLEGADSGAFFSASGHLVARLEDGRQWVITDSSSKREIRLPFSGNPTIEFAPDEKRVLLFPHIHALDNPGSPQMIEGAQPLYQTWSYPGANLVIGVPDDQAGRGLEGHSLLFDWVTGKVSAGPGSVDSLYAISPDGKRFASADHDAILIWTTGENEPSVRSPERTTINRNTPLHFSPDGALLAAGSCSTTRLFDTRNLQPAFNIPMRGCFAGFSPDGKYVVSRLWVEGFPEPTRHPLTLEGVLEETCAKVRSNLTTREWERSEATAYAMASCPETVVGEPAR